MSRLKDTLDLIRKKKEIEEGKEIEFEKGDFKALMFAAFSTFGPILLGLLAFFAFIIWLLTLLFS